MNKLLFFIGTRPEAIKLNSVLEQSKEKFKIKVCLTSQHENIDKFLPKINKKDIVRLDLKRDESGLCGLMGNILNLLDKDQRLKKWQPDLIVVHGDTTSALCGAFYAFYNQIKLCHIEAGLRTHNKFAPFPEECNRKIIDYLSDIHFAPNQNNKKNLIKENIKSYVTGNTVIDFLKNNIKKNYKHPLIDWTAKDKFALLTLHRRENWGENMEKMMLNISKFSIKNEYKIIYVTNQNNKIKKLASRIFKNNKFVKFSNPLEPVDFHNILNHSEFVITDSGGIQEEASFLKKPIVILRNETERDEIVKSKCGVLSSCENLQEVLESVINNTIKFNKTSKLFGSGNSGLKIVSLIEKHLNDY